MELIEHIEPHRTHRTTSNPSNHIEPHRTHQNNQAEFNTRLIPRNYENCIWQSAPECFRAFFIQRAVLHFTRRLVPSLCNIMARGAANAYKGVKGCGLACGSSLELQVAMSICTWRSAHIYAGLVWHSNTTKHPFS